MQKNTASGKRNKSSLFLTAVLVTALLTAAFILPAGTAFAYTGTTDDGYTVTKDYQSTGNTPTLTKYNGSDTELTLPEKATIAEYNGSKEYTVKAVDAFLSDAQKRNVTSVTIPEGYETINASAFKGCTALKTIRIPSTVTRIGSNAFDGCTSLKDVSIAGGKMKLNINNAAFAGCTSLETVTLPSRIKTDEDGTNYFYGCTSLQKIEVAEGNKDYLTEGGALFLKNRDDSDNVTGLTLVTYPEGKLTSEFSIPGKAGEYKVTTLGAHAFRNNRILEKVTVPESVTAFKQYCLSGCSDLKSLTLLAKDTDAVTYETVDPNAFTDLPKGSIIYTVSEEMKAKIENLAQAEVDYYTDLYGYEQSASPRYTNENTTIEVMKAAEPGDLNDDGTVDILDITEAQKYYKAKSGDDNWDKAKNADMNSDGQIDINDLTALYKLIY